MRICYLADAASSHTERWCRYFAGAGHDVHVFSLRPAVIPGVTVHQLVPWLPGKVGYLTVLGRLREMLAHLQPDLVHAHYLTSYGLLGVMAGYRPLIVSMWGSDVLDFPRRSPLHAWLVKTIMARADMLMSTSQAMIDRVADLRPSGMTIHRTPFGVDADWFVPQPEAAGPPVIGAVANLVPEKGLDLLLQALALVPEPVRLVVVGDGPERERLGNLAERLGVAARVDWVGRVAAEALPAWYARMSVVAMPSRRESFGVVALEAAACGRPVVTSRIDGLPETVADGDGGVLVPAGDVSALSVALAGLLADPDKRRVMGRAARDWVCRTYRWEVMAARMADLYEELLQDRQGGMA